MHLAARDAEIDVVERTNAGIGFAGGGDLEARGHLLKTTLAICVIPGVAPGIHVVTGRGGLSAATLSSAAAGAIATRQDK